MANQQFVVCLWDDAWIDANEPMNMIDVETKHKPLRIKTTGWLLKDDDMGISLAAERYLDATQHDVFRTFTFIPRAMIVSITPVSLSKKRKPKATACVEPSSPSSSSSS